MLQKAIYSLKQTPRAWFYTLRTVLFDPRFVQSRDCASLFYKISITSIIFLFIYMDDIVITRSYKY